MTSPQTIFIVIISIVVFGYVLDLLTTYLSITRWSEELPPELKAIYDPEKYKKSQQYERENTKFGLITSTFSFLVMMAMLLLDGFAFVDELVRNYTENPILIALLFFGILGLASDIIGIPFALYQTFVIEEKFGFNRTTVKTFILDKIKGWMLGLVMGGGILALIIWIYQLTGPDFWWYAWATITVFTVFMTMFYASWIVPLFNKLTPLEEGELRTAIENYCKETGFELDDLFVMDGSKRSTKANAFFSGLGKKKRIVLFDTLIEKHTTEEVVAVLAHEIGHFKKKHTRGSLVLSILQTGLMLWIFSLLVENPALSQALGAEQHGIHLGLLVFGILYTPISMLLSIAMNALSRKNEFEADHFAKETYSGEALARALKKLSVDSLSNVRPHPVNVFIYYSHPPLLDRLAHLRSTGQQEAEQKHS